MFGWAFSEIYLGAYVFGVWGGKGYGKLNCLGKTGGVDGLDDGPEEAGGIPVADQFFRAGFFRFFKSRTRQKNDSDGVVVINPIRMNN